MPNMNTPRAIVSMKLSVVQRKIKYSPFMVEHEIYTEAFHFRAKLSKCYLLHSITYTCQVQMQWLLTSRLHTTFVRIGNFQSQIVPFLMASLHIYLKQHFSEKHFCQNIVSDFCFSAIVNFKLTKCQKFSYSTKMGTLFPPNLDAKIPQIVSG